MDVTSGIDDMEWAQQVEYHDIKAQQQLQKQHYGSPAGTPEHYTVDPNDDVKVSLAGLDPQAQLFSDMEKLSNEYEPEVQGPMVGELKSSKALEEEYQNADPAFVRKTIALSPKYNFYRTIRGDGNCGWRAVAFGFFELLMRSHDPNRIGMEHARIESLNNLMDTAGFERYIYEDFASETSDLFRRISASPFDESEVLKSFNDQGISDAIITHFKFLTSAWMKTHPAVYEPFLDRTVKEYCGNQIEPYGIEIDHVGLMALIDCLVIPAAFAVEVFYLDRSPGDEVNVHLFNKLDDATILPPDSPVLRLLYRPGHYDILYRKDDLTSYIPTPEPPPPPMQVSFLPHLPSQLFQETPAAFYPPAPADIDFYPSDSGIGPSNFRQSMFSIPEFQPSPFQPLPFQTTTFRNSPFNPSHFQSENFQPEIYQPPGSSNGSRRGDKPGPP